MEDDLRFDFEQSLEAASALAAAQEDRQEPPDLPAEAIGQQPGNFKKNYRQTVCTYWLRGLCMKGDSCGFLHQFDKERMPVCRTLLKYGECKELDCPYKHSLDEIKECNMYRLGFCIYGPTCRYKHIRLAGPPPEPNTVEACKPREFRNINAVVNQVNPGVAQEFDRSKRARLGYQGSGGGGSSKPLALPYIKDRAPGRNELQQDRDEAGGSFGQQRRPLGDINSISRSSMDGKRHPTDSIDDNRGEARQRRDDHRPSNVPPPKPPPDPPGRGAPRPRPPPGPPPPGPPPLMPHPFHGMPPAFPGPMAPLMPPIPMPSLDMGLPPPPMPGMFPHRPPGPGFPSMMPF